MKHEERDLRLAADAIRVLVADMVEKAKSGHPGGSMGQADVAATLVLRIDGAVAKTWTGVSAGGEYSWEFDLAVGDTKVCSFTLSAAGCANFCAKFFHQRAVDVVGTVKILYDGFTVGAQNG